MEHVPEHLSFPKAEEATLAYWDTIDAFHTSRERNRGLPEFSFYDGPPFATGLPHYGHIIAGTIKDTITRYAHATGHYVERRFGWDCHGLPIEFEIDKKLGVKTRDQVLALGIPAYNAECRSIVMRYSSDWESIVKRLGRWIDFQRDYKTMDTSYMESVWWVFKQLFDKKLIYRGFKVMPYSTACNTPLSNFEANLLYENTPDPEIYVSFPLRDEPATKLVAWTTTPWTLPSNVALCVNPTLDYVRVKGNSSDDTLIVAEALIHNIFPAPKKGAKPVYTVLSKCKGTDLVGLRYVPLFQYFKQYEEFGAFRVLCDDYVKAETGTGIVHQAPAFGEDDYRVCLAAGIIQKGVNLPCPVDDNGRFTADVPDYAGVYVKEADEAIKQDLKKLGRVVKSGTIIHSYPFCWRSETPLIYKAVSSWFVNVESIRDQLVANNQLTYWVPSVIKEKRFHNWLVSAIDWNISRNRYWGTPLPIWASEDYEEMVCIGSIQELHERSGVLVTDLHRESIDHITIPSSRPGRPPLKRVDEVFDCWFESGSMPYAQIHYPFENQDLFEKRFPADFIAEGIDQTRGWFYTLLVLSTCLTGKPAFKNLIVNGLILAEDGKKMSKRLKNYPDPLFIVHEYGADALRMYLLNSPAVHGQEMRFQQQGVRDVIRDVLLPWFNAYRFLVQSALQYQAKSGHTFQFDRSVAFASQNIMDKWVLSASQSLIEYVRDQMQGYFLYKVGPKLVRFIDQLTNWYVRFNRKRMKGAAGPEQTLASLNTLFEVLMTITLAMTPFTPFFTEYVYQNLRRAIAPEQREDSIHYLRFPTPVAEAKDARIEATVATMQSVIELGRCARDRRSKPVKFPLRKVTIILNSEQQLQDLRSVEDYIREELNVREVELSTDDASYVSTKAVPDKKQLGSRLGKQMPTVANAITAMSHHEIKAFQAAGTTEIHGHAININEVQVTRTFTGDASTMESAWDQNALIVLDLTDDAELFAEGVARTMTNLVQKLRKKGGLQAHDKVEVFYQVDDAHLADIVHHRRLDLQHQLGTPMAPLAFKPAAAYVIKDESSKFVNSTVRLVLTRLAFAVAPEAFEQGAAVAGHVERLLNSHNYDRFAAPLTASGSLSLTLDEVVLNLRLNQHVFLSASDRYRATQQQ